jgi:hypothetical protein
MISPLLVILLLLIIIFCFMYINKNRCYNKIHVYLISLPKHIERRQNFEKYYKGEYEYIEAINGNDNKDTELFKNWGCLKSNGNTGTKALQLSNCKIFEDAIKNNYEWIIIFEDDAEPVKKFDKKIQNVINSKYPDSCIIYLDARNEKGEGVIPSCCTAGILYHNSVFKLLAKELNPLTGVYRQDYKDKQKNIIKTNDCLFDFFLANLISHYNIKTSSEPMVHSGRFDSTIN